MHTGSKYLTPSFREAVRFAKSGQLSFLAKLADSPFYKPATNDDTFRDTAVFCLNISGERPDDFALKLKVPESLLMEWMGGQHLPTPALRYKRAVDMIEVALDENGWVGHPMGSAAIDGWNNPRI